MNVSSVSRFVSLIRLAAGLAVILAVAVWVSPTLAQAQNKPSVEQLVGSAISGDVLGPYYQDVSDAIDKFAARDFDSARKLLQDAKKKQAKLAPAEIMMAQLFAMSNQVPAARAELERAVRNQPNDPEAYLSIAELAVSEGRLTEASMVFDKAAKLTEAFNDNAKRKRAFQLKSAAGLATVAENLENWKLAKTYLKKWADLATDSAAAHQRLARAMYQLDEFPAAYAELQAAVKLDDKMPPADITMATFYNGDKNKEKAEEYLNRALKSGAKDFRTRLAAANFMLQNNRLKEAQTHADEAVKLDPKNIDAKIVAGVIARIKGDLKAARSYLDDANRQSPSNFTAMNQLALVLIEGDEESRQRALEYAETNYRSNPKNVEAVSTLGWVNLKLNRMKEAEQALNAVGATGNLNADQLYYFAFAWKDTPKAMDGVKFLEAALKADRPFAYRQQATKLLADLKSKEKKKGSDDDEKGNSDTKKSSPKKGTTKSGSKGGTDKVGSQK